MNRPGTPIVQVVVTTIKPTYTLAVISSRAFANSTIVIDTLNAYVARNGSPSIVYIGQAVEGVNQVVLQWAIHNRYSYVLLHSAIGRIRQCQHLIAFRRDASSGTNARLSFAQRFGVQHITVIDE